MWKFICKYKGLLAIPALYCACLVFITFYQRHLMYFPQQVPVMLDKAGAAELFTAQSNDGLELHGLYWPPASPENLTIVFFHGNAQSNDFWIERGNAYSEEGYGFLLAQYRGYGQNAGEPNEQGLYTDARAYIQALQQRGTKVAQIALMGQSLGTGVAVQMAQEHTGSAGLILLSAYSTTADVAQRQYWMFPVRILMWDQFRSIDKIAGIHMPLLMIHGQQDKTIPIDFAQALFNRANEPKHFLSLPRAGHNDIFSYGAQDYTVGFLRELPYPVNCKNNESGAESSCQ